MCPVARAARFVLPRLTLAVWCVAASVASQRLGAQGSAGRLEVSATILAPVRAATVQASAVRFSAAGDVTFQASAPVIGPTSHIVMLQAVAADSTDRPAAHIVIRTRSGEQRLAEGRSVAMAVGNGNVPDAGRMEIRVERPVRDRAGDRLRARLSYLVVSGT